MLLQGHDELCEVILKVLEPKLIQSGFNKESINTDVDIMSVLDSFAILETIMDIEEESGASVDLAQMNIGETLSVKELAQEILRINS